MPKLERSCDCTCCNVFYKKILRALDLTYREQRCEHLILIWSESEGAVSTFPSCRSLSRVDLCECNLASLMDGLIKAMSLSVEYPIISQVMDKIQNLNVIVSCSMNII